MSARASEPRRPPQPDPVDPVRPPEPPVIDPQEAPPPEPNPDERNPPLTMRARARGLRLAE